MTATDLLASALALPRGGANRCTFCAAPCATPYHLPDSFTAIDRLACPGSAHACSGCLYAATASEGQSPDGKPWMWSWLITPSSAERHALCTMLGGERVTVGRAALREACLNPPPAPYVIALCPSGRTHTLYRSAVHGGGPGAMVNLDGEAVRYEVEQMRERLALCGRVAQEFGVKAARECLPISAGRWTAESADLAKQWEMVRAETLTRAAGVLFAAPE